MLQEVLPYCGGGVSEPERVAVTLDFSDSDMQKLCEFVASAVSDWFSSPRYNDIRTGQRYYENRTDILARKRQVIGRTGEMIDAPYLANNKLPHAFMRKLTKQKIGYLLSRPFTVTGDTDAFTNALADIYLTPDFHKIFKNAGQDAIVTGIGWLQVFYDATGALCFKRIPSTEVIPFWADIDHTDLEAVIRVWDTVSYDGGDTSVVTHAQYYTRRAVFNFVYDSDDVLQPDLMPYEANFGIRYEGIDGIQPAMWAKVPFIPLKYNVEEDSLLKYIKELIDDYDKRTSDLSNTLEEEPDRVKVVKNYDGTDKGEFIFNLARYRTVFLRDTGSVETLDTSVSTDATKDHLERLRKDIYEFGGGVDTQHRDLKDASGVALKFIYADLDMDCSDFGNELAWSMELATYFIREDLRLKGKGDFSKEHVKVTFNTDIIINETETIDNIVKSVGLVSTETLLAEHPYVSDVRKEQAILEHEAQQEFARSLMEFGESNMEFGESNNDANGNDNRDSGSSVDSGNSDTES